MLQTIRKIYAMRKSKNAKLLLDCSLSGDIFPDEGVPTENIDGRKFCRGCLLVSLRSGLVHLLKNYGVYTRFLIEQRSRFDNYNKRRTLWSEEEFQDFTKNVTHDRQVTRDFFRYYFFGWFESLLNFLEHDGEEYEIDGEHFKREFIYGDV